MLERFAPAAFASAFTLAPGLSRIAAMSRCSAVFAAKAEAGRLTLAWRGGG